MFHWNFLERLWSCAHTTPEGRGGYQPHTNHTQRTIQKREGALDNKGSASVPTGCTPDPNAFDLPGPYSWGGLGSGSLRGTWEGVWLEPWPGCAAGCPERGLLWTLQRKSLLGWFLSILCIFSSKRTLSRLNKFHPKKSLWALIKTALDF